MFGLKKVRGIFLSMHVKHNHLFRFLKFTLKLNFMHSGCHTFLNYTFKKVQVGNDQEMAQSERYSHSINRGMGNNYTERQKKPDTYIWIHNRKTRCAIKYRFIQHGRQIISTPFGCKNPHFQLIPFL